MKRLITYCFIFSATAISAFGQGRLRTGFQTGLSISSQTIDRLDGFKPAKIEPVASFHVRSTFELPLASFFSLQTGLSVERKGARSYIPSQSNGSNGVFLTSLTYLEVPLNARINIPFKSWGLFMGAGPYLATGVAGYSVNQGTKYDHLFRSNMGGNGYQAREYGFNVLAGSRIKNIQFNFQYGMGVSNSAPVAYLANPNSPAPFQNSIKNRVFSFGLGYVIDSQEKNKVSRENFLIK